MKNSLLKTLIIVFYFVGFGFVMPVKEPIAIIVNPQNPVEKLTATEVKLYYLRKIKKRWPGIEKNIRPAERKNKCEERTTFHSVILGLSDDDVEEYFVTKQLQNAERPPDKFNTESELITFVSEEPGAIGFVKLNSITAELKSKVKIILTIE